MSVSYLARDGTRAHDARTRAQAGGTPPAPGGTAQACGTQAHSSCSAARGTALACGTLEPRSAAWPLAARSPCPPCLSSRRRRCGRTCPGTR